MPAHASPIPADARSADRFLVALPTLIEDARLPDPVRAMLLEVREQLVALNLRLARCDQQIATHARNSDVANVPANCSASVR